jgi:hypothetical protein
LYLGPVFNRMLQNITQQTRAVPHGSVTTRSHAECQHADCRCVSKMFKLNFALQYQVLLKLLVLIF